MSDKLTKPRVLALWGKGGSGKTTSALAIASLSATAGNRTLIVDADPQRSASEWHSVSENPAFAVHSTDVGQVASLMERAKARYDVVIIDNPPACYAGSAEIAKRADLSLIVARPFRFDVTLAIEWVGRLQRVGTIPLVALTAAPPSRLNTEPPSVKAARARLKQAGALLWQAQITHRLIHPELTQQGLAVASMASSSLARLEYEALWSALQRRPTR